MDVTGGNLDTSGKGDHCQMAMDRSRIFWGVSGCWLPFSAASCSEGRDDKLIMGHNCIISATSIGTNIRFPAVLQLLFAQVTFYKARKSVCCFFSWYVVFCFVFPSSRKLADQKTRKSIDWVDFRLLHYAGEVTYCAVGECVWKLPELLSHWGR